MPKISVVIPVYKAEAYLRKCVESIVYGEEKDIEVLLVEDCSPDGSWNLCLQLAKEYPQVKSLRNERNRGVSYTRNRGVDAASGQFVLFVDSDDWVSGSYAKTLIETQMANPGKLVVCGYTFLDYGSNACVEYGNLKETLIARGDFFALSDAVLMQQLWNKVFCLETIRKAGIRFDESICMGEDYQFVMDVIEAEDYQECVVINRPLYYYIRRGGTSLMDNWAANGSFSGALKRVERLSKICGLEAPEAHRVEMLKNLYVSLISGDRRLSGKEKQKKLREILGDGKKPKNYYKQKVLNIINRFHQTKSATRNFAQRLSNKVQASKNNGIIKANRKHFGAGDVTIISQNCIGGVFSHDMNLQFCSPTVNLYLSAADFLKFVNNLEHYLETDLELRWDEKYPVGKIDDVELRFVHYDTCQQARNAWERRKKRVNLSRVLVLSTDRDGFEGALFEQWKKIPYPKLLFTARREFADHPDVLFFPQYEQFGCVQDLIPKREFYKGNKIVHKANEVGGSKL